MAAVLVALLIVAGVGIAIGRSSGTDDTTSTDASSTYDPMDDDGSTGSSDVDFDAVEEEASDTEVEDPPTTVATAVPPTTAPAPGTVEVGRWILVLDSEPKGESDLAAVQSQAAQVGGPDRGVTVLSSDDTPGLRAGYWVVAVASFDSREAAVGTCASFGRSIGGACYPTRVGDGAR